MLSLSGLCQWVKRRSDAALGKAAGKAANVAGLLAAHAAPGHVKLMQACNKNGPAGLTGDGQLLFIALPEKLLSSLGIFVGNLRTLDDKPEAVTTNAVKSIEALRRDVNADFLNVEDLSGVSQVLVCHGLSPIGDSIALLADFGRALRVACVLGLPVHNMLLDPDWQRINRSIAQVPTLAPVDVAHGLQCCLERRQRLAHALGIEVGVVSLDRPRLLAAAEALQTLAVFLWQLDTLSVLRIEHMRKIVAKLPDETERQYRRELALLRFVARQFNSFDSDVLLYLIGQYWAQAPLRPVSFKMAVESERAFDGPFDDLDDSFRMWTVDNAASVESASKLARVYLPQYELGSAKVLPYTPLSQGLLELAKVDHRLLQDRVIDIDSDSTDEACSAAVLCRTGLVARNRLLSDLSSFIVHCGRLEPGLLDAVSGALFAQPAADLFSAVSPYAGQLLQGELVLSTPESIRAAWNQWLAAMPTQEQPQFMPLHVWFALQEESDWTAHALLAAGRVCMLAKFLYQVLSVA